MANYINKNILCQAYIHVDIELDEEQITILERKINEYISTRGRFFLYEDIETNLEIKDGSLIIYASLLGSLYVGIQQYPKFSEGVKALATDLKKLAQSIGLEALFQTKTKHNQRIRTEARTGIVGRVEYILDQINIIASNFSSVRAKTTCRKINDLCKYVEEDFFPTIIDPIDTKFIAVNLAQEIEKKFPTILPADPRKPHSPDDLRSYRIVRKTFIDKIKEIQNK